MIRTGLLAAIILCLFAAAPTYAFTQQELCAKDTPYVPISERLRPGLLFSLEKCHQKTSYLFGTIHSDEPDLLDNNAQAVATLQSADVAIFEMIQSPELQQQVARYMIYPVQQREGLSYVIGMELYEQALTRMQRLQPDMPPAFFERFRPWAVAILLQYPPQAADGIVLDVRMQQLAAAQGVRLAGLETAAEQFGFFTDLSLREQVEMLTDAIDRTEEIRKLNRELFAAYRGKDLQSIAELSETSFAGIKDDEFARKLQTFLITDRNQVMVTRMLPSIRKGNAFVAVGALHLPGDDGLLRLLESKGYFISHAD